MATVPDRVTVLFGASVSSSTALSTTEEVGPEVLLVLPAAIVSTLLALREKSLAVVPVPAAADTVIVVSSPEAAPSVAFTTVAVFSASVVLSAMSVTAGASSSSSIVPVPVPMTLPTAPSATTTVSSLSCALSPVTVTVTVLLVSPAANCRTEVPNRV